MRWIYFTKILLKSILLLVVSLFVLAVVYDTSSKARVKITGTNWTPGKVSEKLEGVKEWFKEIHNPLSERVKLKTEEDHNGPYLTSTEVELGGTEPKDYQKILRYHERFWDLYVPSDTNASFIPNKTQSVMNDDLWNLWRPLKGQPEADESDRIVPQLVWQMEASNSSFSQKIKPKRILIWDSFKWWSKFSWQDKGPHELEESDCPHTPGSVGQCLFTDDVSELNKADAVITARDSFHTTDVVVPEQTLKFNFILESPFHSGAKLTRTNDLLATYWRGSDVVTPYSKWLYHDLSKKLKPHGRDYTVGKTKPVAIFVSNCDAWNNRMGYVKELQESIHVDVYGLCGSLNCKRSKEKSCFEMLQKDYFFYLSFENSNCRDYITEKLFTNGLKNDVIPIVMGAHPDDYKAMAPYKSYIHVEDFDDPKELGVYLNFLINHPSEYNKYFEWKGTGEFISSDLFCRVCAMVHYADLLPPPQRQKPFRWGQSHAINDRMCLQKGAWYWSKKVKTHSRPSKSTRNLLELENPLLRAEMGGES